MFDWKDILRKNIILPIKINDKVKYFKYKQFTIQDTLDFHYNEENKSLWLFKFLNKQWEKKRFFWRHKLSKKEFMEIPFDILYKEVIGSAMEWFYDFSINSNIVNKESEEYPLSAYIALISKELSISPLDIINKFTPLQLKTFSEWVMWNFNSQTDEGQKKNEKILNLRKINSMDKNILTNSLDKLRWVHNKHTKKK